MASLTGKLSRKGRVTLPKEVREAIGVKPGDTIAYEICEDVVTLKRVEPLDVAFHGALSATVNEWMSQEDEEAFCDL